MKLPARILLISLLLFFMQVFSYIYAHDKTLNSLILLTDSLKNELLNKDLTKKDQMRIYGQITGTYASFDIDSVLVYAPIAIKLSTEQKDKMTTLRNYNHWGMAYCFRSKYDSASYCINKSREIAYQLNMEEAIAVTYALDAFIFIHQDKPLTAIEYYLKALSTYEEIEDKTYMIYSNITNILSRLAQLNRELNNIDVAITYLDRSLETVKYITEPGTYEWRLTKIYNEYAASFLSLGDLENAFKFAQMAYNEYTRTSPLHQCQTNVLLANIYLIQHNLDKARSHAKEAMNSADIIKERKLYNSAKLILSQIYLAEKNYAQTEEIAIKIYQSDSADINNSELAIFNIALANIYMHNEDKAALYLHKYSEKQKEYAKKSFQATVADMSVKYEIGKKELRIKSLEKEKQLYFWLGIGGLLFTCSFGLVFWLSIRNNKKEKQLIAIRSVMDGEMKERTRLAHDLHDRLGGNLSAIKIGLVETSEITKNTNEKLDTCIEEVRRIAHNLMPISLQYGIKTALEDFSSQFPNVHFHFFGDNYRSEEQAEFIIYCCANELVNNAIQHAEAQSIHMQLIQNKKHITLTVQDDGKGFDQKSITSGLGLKNIQDRITSCKGKLDITSSINKGTEVTIEIQKNPSFLS